VWFFFLSGRSFAAIMSETSSGQFLPVMETFYTLQGEGYHAGVPAYFIRIGGCDVGCVWCDVKESWDASKHPVSDVEVLARNVDASGARVCVVTGGEPAMYNLEPLTRALRHHGIRTHIETSGVYPVTGDWDWITFSPKKFKAPYESIYQLADELKVIVFHPSDLSWAEEHASKVRPECMLFLQAEWDKKERSYPLILEYIGKNPQWRLSMQVHKYLGVD
jgi:organic radical activating enzyme